MVGQPQPRPPLITDSAEPGESWQVAQVPEHPYPAPEGRGHRDRRADLSRAVWPSRGISEFGGRAGSGIPYLAAVPFISRHVVKAGSAIRYINYLVELKPQAVKELQRFVIFNMDVRDDRDWDRAVRIVVPVIRR